MSEAPHDAIRETDPKGYILSRLRTINDEFSPDQAHSEAERLLLQYVNDPEITAAWNEEADEWWYS